jgi:hypothetical protein
VRSRSTCASNFLLAYFARARSSDPTPVRPIPRPFVRSHAGHAAESRAATANTYKMDDNQFNGSGYGYGRYKTLVLAQGRVARATPGSSLVLRANNTKYGLKAVRLPAAHRLETSKSETDTLTALQEDPRDVRRPSRAPPALLGVTA